jgi:hypothetical protein
MHNVRRYTLLPLQGSFMSGYPQDVQMNKHWQPLNPAIAYDRLLAAGNLLVKYKFALICISWFRGI